MERGRRQGREEESKQAAMFDVEFIPWRAKQSWILFEHGARIEWVRAGFSCKACG